MKVLRLFLGFALLNSCHFENKQEPVTRGSDSVQRVSNKELPGVYYGVLPCADCQGIEYTLTLSPDSTFYLKSIYYGKPQDANTFVDAGNWNMQDTNIIQLETSQDNYYLKIKQKNLLWLDQQGKEITHTKANYQLSRIGKFEN